MHTQTVIFQSLTLEQLVDAIRPMIRHELAQAQLAIVPAQPLADKLVTVPEAAALLNVSVATIHEHKRLGRLAYCKIGGRTYFKHSDLLAAGTREQRTVKPARTKGKPPS
jgi:excisionase family DNA binding protein